MKKVISMLVVMIMLISSFGAFSVSAAEPETYPDTLFYDFNSYSSDSHTWGSIANWGDKRWSASGGSGKYQFTDEHSYVYKFKTNAANPTLNLDEAVTEGKYLINFDWYNESAEEGTRYLVLRLYDEENIVDKSATICLLKDNVVQSANVIESPKTAYTTYAAMKDGKWYNLSFLIDKDNGTIDYYVDGKWYVQTTGTILDFTKIRIYTNSAKGAISYMDNFLAGYAGNAHATAFDSKMNSDGDIFTTTYPVDKTTLSTVKLYNEENEEASVNVIASADGKTVSVSPVTALAENSTYRVDISNLKSIYKIGYLESSLNISTGKIYPTQRYDFETYKGNSKPWDKMENWDDDWFSSGGGSGPMYMNDSHGYVVKFKLKGTKPGLYFDKVITEGKYLVSFDYQVPRDSVKRTGIFLYNEDKSVKVSIGVFNGLKLIAGNFTSNWPGWTGDGYYTLEADRWYNLAFLIDKDNGTVSYFVDGVQYEQLKGTIPDTKLIFFNTDSGEEALAYMDNVYAGPVSGATASVNSATADGGVRVLLEQAVDSETINNAVLKDMSDNIVETMNVVSDDKKTVYMIPETALTEVEYTVDLSEIKNVYGGKYENRIQTVAVESISETYTFDDVSTGSWEYIPQGFTTGKATGRYNFNDGHGYTYYCRNYGGQTNLSKKLDEAINDGMIYVGFDYYSFKQGTHIKFITDHYTSDTAYTTNYFIEFDNQNSINLYENLSSSTATKYGDYTQEKWYNVGLIFDFDNNNVVIYLDGVKVAERRFDAESIGRIRFDANTTQKDDKVLYYAIDNVSIVRMSRTVAKSFGAYDDANNIYINFNAPIKEDTISNIVLTDGSGNEIETEKALTYAGKKLLLTYDGVFTAGESYTVSLDGVYDMANLAVLTDEINITVEQRPAPVYSPLTVSGTTVSSTVTNMGEAAKSHVFIVAGYTGGIATAIGIGRVSYKADEATKVLSYDFGELDLSGCDSAKAFFWNNLTDIIPLVEALPLEI